MVCSFLYKYSWQVYVNYKAKSETGDKPDRNFQILTKMSKSIYDIIAYAILAIALFFIVRNIIMRLGKKKISDNKCNSGCTGCNTPCELKEAIMNQKK